MFDNARNEKTSLEAQVVTLEDLKFSTDDETILAQLDEKTKELNGKIEKALDTIDSAQVAFNEIATQIQEIEVKRAEEEAEAAKTQAFLDAQSHYQYLKSIVDDINVRLSFFDEAPEEPAGGKDEKELPPCEPQFLYELDYNNIPQVSW